jgi:four helix bundle protein
MFLILNHQKLDVYSFSRLFVLECYKLTKVLPIDEKFGMISQIRRAALSVHLNIAEGASRKSEIERKRFYEMSRGSIIEIDAASDIASDLKYLENYDVSRLGEEMLRSFKMLSGLIKSNMAKE